LVATTALVHGVTPFSLNNRDFRFIDGLALHQHA
jgi:hypothetical protein